MPGERIQRPTDRLLDLRAQAAGVDVPIGGAYPEFPHQRLGPGGIPQRRADAARSAQRREQVLTSAPGIWALVIVVALTLPVILSTSASVSHPIYGSP